MTSSRRAADTAPRKPLDLPTLDDLKALAVQFNLPGVDVNALVEWHRKDLETLAEANRQAYEGMKALTERRGEILRETLAQWQETLKDATGQEAFARQTEAAQRGVQQAIDHVRELSEMEAQTRENAWKVLQNRMRENVANLQRQLQAKY